MTPQEMIEYGMQKAGAYTDCPFGPEPICLRVEKRIFAEVFFSKPWVTLKCEPAQGVAWREAYPEQVRRGWHCPPVQQPYNNTVTPGGSISDALFKEMMDHSYDRALQSLTRAARERVQGAKEDA